MNHNSLFGTTLAGEVMGLTYSKNKPQGHENEYFYAFHLTKWIWAYGLNRATQLAYCTLNN